MNNELFQYLIYLKVVLAQSFTRLSRVGGFLRAQGLGLLSLINNYPFPLLEFLERIFPQKQGVCLLPHGCVLVYIEYVQTGENNAVISKKNRQKTNPIGKLLKMNVTKVLTNNYEDQQKMQNEPNGMLFKPYSKPKNRLFGNFTKPFYAKRTQWYVIRTQNKPNLLFENLSG